MKPKRSFLKTICLLLIRYERWKLNPKNFDSYIMMNNFIKRNGGLF